MALLLVSGLGLSGCDSGSSDAPKGTNLDVYTSFTKEVTAIITAAFGSGATVAPSVQGVEIDGSKGSVTFETSNPIIFSFWHYSSDGETVVSPDNGNGIPDFEGESSTPDVETLEATIDESALAPAADGTYEFDAFETTTPMTGALTLAGKYPGAVDANLTLKYIVTVDNMAEVLAGTATPVLGQEYIQLSGTVTVKSDDVAEAETFDFPATSLIPL